MTARARIAVLIVEDEGIIAQNLREQLSSVGYEPVTLASSSDEAIARASERCPDVVLMDIRIKGKLDGIATAELLQQRFHVPIIYLTAHADQATLERAKRTEPFGYLVKPIKLAEVRSAIEIAHYKHTLERHLRARERWLSTTMRSIADAVIMVDLAGLVTYLNPAAETLLGVTLAETQGRPAREILRLRYAEGLSDETPLDRALRERQAVTVAEAILEPAHGAERVVEDSAAPVIDDDELLGAVMVVRDVTEQKRLQQQLELADRLVSLGTMAAGVAHEINNPLAVILGNAELALETLSADASSPASAPPAPERYESLLEDLRESQTEIRSAAQRIGRIVSDLLTFARPQVDPYGSVEVNEVVQRAVRSTWHELCQRARVVTNLGNVPRVDGDPTRLGQVVVNLLINAAHAITPGEALANTITVTTRTDAEGQVVVAVQDTGSGIPANVLPRVFEPFFTTKALGVGTGLGLSICHGIVTSLGGTLEVESRVGEGSTFRVQLPPSAREPSLPPEPPSTAVSQRRGRVLIIDDDPLVLKTLTRMLGYHQVRAVPSAEEALASFDEGASFDVILCDLMMPSMTGMAFYERLLGARPDQAARVVFLTGGAMTPKCESFLHTVPNQCFRKPFQALALRELVRQMLAAEGEHSA